MAEIDEKAQLIVDGQTIELPVLEGSEGERAIDISTLRNRTGYVTLDERFSNTGSCRSSITFVEGEKGICRYRGIPVEELAEKSTFVETSYLLIYGELPNKEEHQKWSGLFTEHAMIHEGLHHHFDGFPATSDPMAILSAMINAASCYAPELLRMDDESTFELSAARLISKIRTIAAAAYKTSIGQPIIYPKPSLDYCSNFMHMMFSVPYANYQLDPEVTAALGRILIMHADHEQNCSTSTVRMVASTGANLYASCAAGVCALWGPLHGGANVAVIKMLQYLHDNRIDPADYLERIKSKEEGLRLQGFGHRVYRNFDPRARIIKATVDGLLKKLKRVDPLLEIAKRLEDLALKDPYFVERKLYPNVDFYSGIGLRAIGIPVNMFTVMFAMGRMPGWIAHWKEEHDMNTGIFRPRQIYQGLAERSYVPIDERP